MILQELRTRLHAAAQAIAGKPLLAAHSVWDQYLYGPEDSMIQTKGVDAYFDMASTDSEIASSVDIYVQSSLPGVSVVPGGEEPEDKRNSDFITAILTEMNGSTLDPFAQYLRNAAISGLSIGEPIYKRSFLPGIGPVIGLEGFFTRSSRSFIEATRGIEVDQYGRVVKFRQSAEFGGKEVNPGDVVYYALNGGPENRYGCSVLRPVYESWAAKIKIRRVYQVFIVTNASGTRNARMTKEDFNDPKKRAAAQAVMDKLGSLNSFVSNKDWELIIDKPGSGTGGHFKEILVYLNEEIRRGILGDSSFNAQDGTQGSQASRTVSQDNVRSKFQTIGSSVCDSISEQLFPMILRTNGYTTGAVPKMQPMAIVSSAQARGEALASLGDLRQKGVLKRDLPESAELAIYKNILSPMNIEIDSLQEVPTVTPYSPVAAAEHKHKRVHAADSKGRARAKKDMRDLQSNIDTASADLAATWAAISPLVQAELSKKIFEQRTGGGWKTTDLTAIRQIIVETIRFKQSDIRKSLTAGMETAYDTGKATAQEIVPIKAAAAYGWTSQQARAALQNRIMLLLEDKYGSLAARMYYQIENALIGNLSILEAEASIKTVLGNSPYADQYARTILDTAMSSAWNHARDEMFSNIEKPGGTTSVDIVGYEFVAIIDDYTTEQCEELDGMYFACDDPSRPKPPLHYNCRSVLLPVFGDQSASVTWTDRSESKAIVSRMQANNQIQQGFGGL